MAVINPVQSATIASSAHQNGLIAQVNTNTDDIADEVTARTNADNTLSNRLGSGITTGSPAASQINAVSSRVSTLEGQNLDARLGSGVTTGSTATSQLSSINTKLTGVGTTSNATTGHAGAQLDSLRSRVSSLESGGGVAPVLLTARRATDLTYTGQTAVNIPFDFEVSDTNNLFSPQSSTSQTLSQFTGFPTGQYEIVLGCAVQNSSSGFSSTFGLYILLNPNIAGGQFGAGQYGLAAVEQPSGSNVCTAQCVVRATLTPSDIITARFYCTTGNNNVALKAFPYYGGTQISFLKIG